MPTKYRTLKLASLVAVALTPLAFGTAAQAQLPDVLSMVLYPQQPPPAAAPPAAAPAPPPAAAPTPPPAAAPAPAAASAASTPLQVEQRLEALRYDVGAADGVVDAATGEAVMAFQKTHGMERTGVLDDAVSTRVLAENSPPPPLQPGGGENRVEVDLNRQILMVYEGDSLSRILPISSGTPATPTPTGSYKINHRVSGWETGPLGRLYNSQYFKGGYAIHGSLSVPGHPASHGCVRIPMRAADWLPDHVAIGTPVYIFG